MNRPSFACTVSVLCLIFFLSGLSTAWSQNVDFVFYQPLASFKDNTEAVTSLRSLEKLLVRYLQTSVKGHFFQKDLDMQKFIETSKPAFGFLDLRYYVEKSTQYNMQPVAIPERNGKTATPALLVVRADSGYNSVFDLKGKLLTTTAKGEVNVNFLSNLIFEKRLDVSTFFSLKFVDTSNSALHALNYKEADAAIIDKVIFDSKFPQKANFKVLFTTRDIPFPPIIVFQDNIKPGFFEKLQAAFLKLADNPEGKQFNGALNISSWKAATDDDFSEVRELLNNPASSFTREPVLAESTQNTKKIEPSPYTIKPEALPLLTLSDSQVITPQPE